MIDNDDRPFQVGDEVHWAWKGPGYSDDWFNARLVQKSPDEYPTGWAGEITDRGTLYAAGKWDLPVGALVFVDEASITLVAPS